MKDSNLTFEPLLTADEAADRLRIHAKTLQRLPREKHALFLNPEEAAEFLGGLNTRTVTRWAREGYLPAFPIGEGKRRLWRFLEVDLARWMLSRRTGTLLAATDAPTRRLLEG